MKHIVETDPDSAAGAPALEQLVAFRNEYRHHQSQNVPRDAYRVLTWELPTETPPLPRPSASVSRTFSGRNCAVLKQIYFNTWHNIWTKKEHFYILLSRSKNKKRKRGGFLSFAVLHSDFATFDAFFCHEEATTRLGGSVCWLLK